MRLPSRTRRQMTVSQSEKRLSLKCSQIFPVALILDRGFATHDRCGHTALTKRSNSSKPTAILRTVIAKAAELRI